MATRSAAAGSAVPRPVEAQPVGSRPIEARPVEARPFGDGPDASRPTEPAPEVVLEVAARHRRLTEAARYLETFEPSSHYESEVKGTTLAMIRYMAEYWCAPEEVENFDRWWQFVDRYLVALDSGTLVGRGARKRMDRLLDRNQIRPLDLNELWLIPWTNGRPHLGLRKL